MVSDTSNEGRLLPRLVGTELSQVWFVRDYVQLIFDDEWTLTLLAWPRLTRGERTLAFGDPGYRDSLCGFIDDSVTSVAEERGLRVELGHGTLILEPSVDELWGPEVALMHQWGDGSELAVWLAGESPFEYLA